AYRDFACRLAPPDRGQHRWRVPLHQICPARHAARRRGLDHRPVVACGTARISGARGLLRQQGRGAAASQSGRDGMRRSRREHPGQFGASGPDRHADLAARHGRARARQGHCAACAGRRSAGGRQGRAISRLGCVELHDRRGARTRRRHVRRNRAGPTVKGRGAFGRSKIRREEAMATAVVLRLTEPAVLALTLAVLSVAALAQPKDAEPATREANAAVLNALPFSDRQDFEDARRGFVATLPDGVIRGSGAIPVWSMKPYGFLDREDAPATVNPSLWRQARLNAIHGLFKVADRVYQVRGLDLANMTIIEGDAGIIVLDTLLTAEAARAALDLYYANGPRKPVTAVIYSHSHVDHFGGVKGVVSEADVAAGRVKIYAPDGFMEHAVSENVIAGNAMSRRAQYMYGPLLPPREKGQVDTGLGKNLSRGTLTLLAPTDLIRQNE